MESIQNQTPAVAGASTVVAIAIAPRGKRRIAVALDHPAVRGLGISAWAVAGVSFLAIRVPWVMRSLTVLVIAGLAIGLINGLRWLFGRA